MQEVICEKKITIKGIKEEIETLKMEQKHNTAQVSVFHGKITRNKQNTQNLKVVDGGDVNHEE